MVPIITAVAALIAAITGLVRAFKGAKESTVISFTKNGEENKKS